MTKKFTFPNRYRGRFVILNPRAGCNALVESMAWASNTVVTTYEYVDDLVVKVEIQGKTNAYIDRFRKLWKDDIIITEINN